MGEDGPLGLEMGPSNLQIASRVSSPSPLPPNISLLASSSLLFGGYFLGASLCGSSSSRRIYGIAHRWRARVLISDFIHYRRNTPEIDIVPEAFEGTINRESGKISMTPRVHKEQTKKENLKE
ncbi:uncharacterized protein LOC127741546 [Arachis duranensis]|uniref:Uncharacterized protein LOC127741546 n=1 Tax=Arachis duranensis TaxID=130453 RepID=A0A9C6T5C6_ARADU|nr:uncharacterized protein LOC112709126 [Arachis hypogaea]XP_052110231.1 uncharacterized protein LOC127741546 [Arachis duranensis]